jgi:flavin reductase (DIM6/NTAB) family NADH-FMN oxidoreductase RutF
MLEYRRASGESPYVACDDTEMEAVSVKEKVSLSSDKRSWSPSPLVGQIVLVTTLNEDSQSNVAPKSWISMMAFEPPLLALGCNSTHWTAQNILRTHEFAINIPGEDMVDRIWRMPGMAHPRTVERVGLTPILAQKVKPPLIEECKAHLECILVHHLEFESEIIFLGKIVAGSVDKEAYDSPDPYHFLKMLVFLENGTFGVIEHGQRIAPERGDGGMGRRWGGAFYDKEYDNTH